MEEKSNEQASNGAPCVVPESPKQSFAFTIDFESEKKVDTQRHKSLAEKFQKRHKRGQSLSKLEESSTAPVTPKQHPLSANLPRKSSFQSEGYFSSDEKPERAKSAKTCIKRSDLTLLLRNVTSERMTQSFPNPVLPSIESPQDCELKDISSPELDLISPFSPRTSDEPVRTSDKPVKTLDEPVRASDETLVPKKSPSSQEVFIEGTDFDFDRKSDTVSEAGTYTLDGENYSEEQKARMSIDKEFGIEEVSVQKKTEEYVKSLSSVREQVLQNSLINRPTYLGNDIAEAIKSVHLSDDMKSPRSPIVKPKLSPILSPTQNISIVDQEESSEKTVNNGDNDSLNNTFTKIMYPSPKARKEGLGNNVDQGAVISVTSSGAFRSKSDKKKLERRHSLTKSEVQVQAYIDGRSVIETVRTNNTSNLTANIVNVQSIEDSNSVVCGNLLVGKVSNITGGLPPAVGGKTSPSKIPSPIHTPNHTLTRPRSRNSLSSMNVELSDSSLDTEVFLKPTQNYINTLQQKLSLDSDPDSDYDVRYGMKLNNTAHLFKQRPSHTRHNSLDDRTINNKLEHFQNKNLKSIDQTYSNLLNQYHQTKVIQKIHNSPNNSPIRRSSSFSTKNLINPLPKNTNITATQIDSELRNSPNSLRNTSIQRSSSTASIQPNYMLNRRSSIGEHKKLDRNQFADTESSSEEDFDRNRQKKKDLGSISNTRCNRAFSLRRARIDDPPKCPNTPEMRRKTFQTDIKQERAISVDRKSIKTNDIQSRYLLNITKRGTPPPANKDIVKNVPNTKGNTPTSLPKTSNKPQAFSRTDTGRFSMRQSPKPVANLPKTPRSTKKDPSGKKPSSGGGGARSNSSLSSREVEFQNWKRRKSYDPMKAAAEGRRRELQQRRQVGGEVNAVGMTQSCLEAGSMAAGGGRSPDSSPSRSAGSVHRSQVSARLNNMMVNGYC